MSKREERNFRVYEHFCERANLVRQDGEPFWGAMLKVICEARIEEEKTGKPWLPKDDKNKSLVMH